MELLQIMGAAWLSKSVAVAARLSIADELKQGPLSLKQLAERTGTHAASLLRLLRLLRTFQIFQITDDGQISNSPASEPLRSDHPLSMRHYCMLAGEEYYDGWGGLLHTVRTGEPGFAHVFGSSIYDYLDRHPDSAQVYDHAMRDLSRPVGAALANEYGHRFGKARKIVDVGGGSGVVTSQLVRAYPNLRGTVIDREEVCRRASEGMDADLCDRLSYRPGDFFAAVPADGDIYILKNVLHNWNEEYCTRILDTLARAMRESGHDATEPVRLLVIEPLVEPQEDSPRLVFNALLQIVICQEGTRDRTSSEMRELLQRSGLRVEGSRRLSTGHTVMEAQLQ